MTQFDKIISLFKSNQELSIKDISDVTWIKEPNIRRILWQWTLWWVFKRICKWVYSLKNWDTEIWFINWDALEVVKHLDIKFDLIFLDIPYNTPAVIWGNRWVKYDLISIDQFNIFLNDLKNCVKDDTYIVHCFSNAPSWMKKMMQYNNKITNNWFKLISENTWSKITKDWNPCTNMRWNIMPPEWINIYSLSWKQIDYSKNFCMAKTKTASQKPYELIKELFLVLMKKWQWMLDPFAWTWITWLVSYDIWINSIIIEKSFDRFYNEILLLN